MTMKLQRANSRETRHACMRFHYARAVPAGRLASYSVFEDDLWCGAIMYGRGATPHIATPFGLGQGEVVELVRVALNGSQSSTSKALAVSLKLLHKDAPLARVVVSYADTAQGHVGTIYQATNWVCMTHGEETARWIEFRGKLTHPKSLYSRYGTQAVPELRKFDPNCRWVDVPAKIKYAYALDPSWWPRLRSESREYLRRKQSSDAPGLQPGQDGAAPIPPLHDDAEPVAAAPPDKAP